MIVQDVKCYRTLDESGEERVVVSWNLVVPDNPSILGFNIYRADVDNYVKIKQGCTQNFFLDLTADLFPGKDYYYKVTYLTSQGESSLDEASSVNLYTDVPSGYASDHLYYPILEAISRCNWGLQQLGEQIKILIRKRVGVKCPKCYDPLAERSPDPRCTYCWGTGIADGYDLYSVRSIIYEAPAETLISTPFGIQATYVPRGVITNFPILHENDLIKRQDNRGYMVSNVIPFYIQNYLVEQQYTISQMDQSHVVYSIKLS